MSKSPLQLAYEWHAAESRWDQVLLVLVVGLIAFTPLALGAVEPWSELVVVVVAMAMSLVVAARWTLDREFRLARSWTFVPLAVVLGLLALQLTPLPPGLLGVIAPGQEELRGELLGGHAPQATGQWSTLSLYPYATAHDLRLALVFTTLFLTVASTFRSSQQIKRLLAAVFLIGCAEAAISLLQILTMSTQIHWTFAERGKIVTSGSFINYSNFCQFVNLALGAGVALLLVKMSEDRQAERSRSKQLSLTGWERYAPLLAGLVACAVAVLVSMSRNGAISLFVAAAVMGGLLFYRGTISARGWLLAMAPWCVLTVLFLTCFDAVYDRLATLEDRTYFDQRLEMTSGALRAWQAFPVWGVGVGAHEFVFPMFDTAVSTQVAEHADNDWAQLLEEFGLVGAAAIAVFVLSVFAVAGKLMLRGRSPLSTAAFGLSAGLLATAIHSLSDFGQHLPAVFSLTAVGSGLLVAIAARERWSKKQPKQGDTQLAPAKEGAKQREPKQGNTQLAPKGAWPAWVRYASGAGAIVGLAFVWGWAGQGALAAYRGDAWANAALDLDDRLHSDDWPVDDPDQVYSDLLTAATTAWEAEPGNVRHGHLLNLFRWESISRARDPETGEVLLHPDVLPFVGEIADELAEVRELCPTYGPPCGLEGELRWLVLDDPQGAALIRQAARLAPYHPRSSFVAGQLAIQQDQVDEAVDHLTRAVALDPSYFGVVVQRYLDELRRPDLAVALAGDDHGRLEQVAALLELQGLEGQGLDGQESPSAEYAALAQELRGRALDRLRERVEAGEATASEQVRLAEEAVASGDQQAAIALYRRALAKNYDQLGWRLALVAVLAEVGETDQAMREAKICLRLRPGSPAATQWIGKLSVMPGPEGAASKRVEK